jgi:hypothetical protein
MKKSTITKFYYYAYIVGGLLIILGIFGTFYKICKI